MDKLITESTIDPSASIYAGARIKKSELGEGVVIGNFSRIDLCRLANRVRVDRNNYLFKSYVGTRTYTGMNTVIMQANIGSFCSISWNVTIGGANHDYNRVSQHSFLYNNHDKLRPSDKDIAYERFSEPLDIGSDVWIAAGAVILRGLKIGHGAVIGANSVVTRDVPPYAVVAGSPAKMISQRFEDKIVELLLELKWWEWDDLKIEDNYNFLASEPNSMQLDSLLKND